MQVILLERIEKLGQMGDVVTVKPGYARNFLLPQKKALRATNDNIAYFEGQRSQLEAENLTRKSEAEAVAAKMTGAAIVVIRQAGDAGHLYGSVNSRDVAIGLTDEGYTTDKQQVTIERPIKDIGIHPIRVQLHPEVSVEISVNVARSTDEAQVQAERAARGEDPIATLIDEDSAAERAAQDEADSAAIEEVFEPEAMETAGDAEDAAEMDTGTEPEREGTSADADPAPEDGGEPKPDA